MRTSAVAVLAVLAVAPAMARECAHPAAAMSFMINDVMACARRSLISIGTQPTHTVRLPLMSFASRRPDP